MSTNVGSIHYDLKLDTSKFDAESAKVKSKISSVGDKFSSFGANVAKSALVASAGIAAMGAILTPTIRDAVKRVDTLNNAPKVLQNLGFSAEESGASMQILEKSIRGLPTSLDDATTALLSITAASGRGIKESTKLTVAFNNMALAGGKGPQEAQRALVQFTQALGRGKMGMQEFNTLAEVMPAQLNQVAKSMLGADANISTLREALGSGSISMNQFADQIVKLNEQGGDGFASFATQAKTATGGIGTAFTNMQTAMTRGMAKIIQSIGADRISNALNTIGKSLETVFKIVADNVDTVAFFIGVVLATAFGVLAVKVIIATWPILAVAAALTGLYLAGKFLYDRFRPEIDAVIATIVDIWKKSEPVRNFIANQFRQAWEQLANAVRQLITALAPYKNELMVIGGILLAAFVAPTLIAIGVLAGIVFAIIKVITWLAQFQTFILNTTTAFRNWANNTVATIAGTINNIGNWFMSLPGRIRAALGNLGGLLYGAGRDLIQGLINGINNMASAVFNRARQIANDAANAIKNALRIKSPSRVTLGLGMEVGRGLELGLEKSIPDVNAMANKLALGAVATPQLAAQAPTTTQTTSVNNNIYGNISLGDQSAVDRFFDRLNRNGELTAKGMTTL